jgi:hypothetical protein
VPQPSYTVAFVQITGVGDKLYGLDKEGRVWRYVPPMEQTKGKQTWQSKSFWTKLTARGKDPADKRREDDE